MTKHVTSSLLLIALSVALFSCGGGGDDPSPVANTATFLKVGTKYNFYYDDNFFNQDSITTVVEKQLATDTFLVRNYSKTISVASTQYWVLSNNTFSTSFRQRDPSTYQIECKFGKPVGTTWTVTKINATYTYSIEALNVAITTGSGVVSDAIKIKVHAPTGQDLFQYVSPTVGLLGTGSISENTSTKLYHYKIGTTPLETKAMLAITYGNFSFMSVGKYWEYTEDDLGSKVEVTLLIESKLPSKNIYKVKLTYDGEVSYSYWFEDNGMLMVYEGSETVKNADPIYMSESIAAVDYGWVGLTPTNTLFYYKIESLNETMDTGFFGELPVMGISVSNGIFSSQVNYWHSTKGNVLVSGFVSREVVASNARNHTAQSFIPVIAM